GFRKARRCCRCDSATAKVATPKNGPKTCACASSRRWPVAAKCKHKIMHLREMGLGGFHMGFQFMCLDCGAATSFCLSVREARRRLEAGRLITNETLAAEAARISKLKVDSIEAQAKAHAEVARG